MHKNRVHNNPEVDGLQQQMTTSGSTQPRTVTLVYLDSVPLATTERLQQIFCAVIILKSSMMSSLILDPSTTVNAYLLIMSLYVVVCSAGGAACLRVLTAY